MKLNTKQWRAVEGINQLNSIPSNDVYYNYNRRHKNTRKNTKKGFLYFTKPAIVILNFNTLYHKK